MLVLNVTAAALFIFTWERLLKNCIWLLKHTGYFSSPELESMWKKYFGDISLILIDSICLQRMGKEVKESTELRSYNFVYFTSVSLCFANAVIFVSLSHNISYNHCYMKLLKRQEILIYCICLAFTKV